MSGESPQVAMDALLDHERRVSLIHAGLTRPDPEFPELRDYNLDRTNPDPFVNREMGGFVAKLLSLPYNGSTPSVDTLARRGGVPSAHPELIQRSSGAHPTRLLAEALYRFAESGLQVGEMVSDGGVRWSNAFYRQLLTREHEPNGCEGLYAFPFKTQVKGWESFAVHLLDDVTLRSTTT